MKFSLEAVNNANQIHSYTDNSVTIRTAEQSDLSQDTSLIIMPNQLIYDWSIHDISELTQQHIDQLKQLAPEVVILVSNSHDLPLRFKLTEQFSAQNMGVEFMPLGAACRSYNLLSAEGRKVVLAVHFDNN